MTVFGGHATVSAVLKKNYCVVVRGGVVAPRKVVRALTMTHLWNTFHLHDSVAIVYTGAASESPLATDPTGQPASLEEFLILPSYENPPMWSLSEESAREASHDA
jgi:hypothetical protein